MVDASTGEVKGRHDGLMYYTLGQRQGLGIGGSGTGEPWFVADKDLERNVLYVVQGERDPILYSHGLTAGQVNWIAPRPARSAAALHGEVPLQAAGSGRDADAAGRRNGRGRLRRAAKGDNARTGRRLLRWRDMPGRRDDRSRAQSRIAFAKLKRRHTAQHFMKTPAALS
ncbi:tRNA methyl transferase PRC-barrel domain-containing protein [Cohnella rhizosphaerae]